MNAAGALSAYARQSAQALTGNGKQPQVRKLAVSRSLATDARAFAQPAGVAATQSPLTSGLDLLV